MKKIILFTLFLMSYVSICLASLDMPKDERWYLVDGSDKPQKFDLWIDYSLIKFAKSTELGYRHNSHKAAKAWILTNSYDIDIKTLSYMEFDIECNTIRQLNNTAYSSDGLVISSDTREQITATPIIPGSVASSALYLINEYRKVYKDKEKLAEFLRNQRTYTTKYKQGLLTEK